MAPHLKRLIVCSQIIPDAAGNIVKNPLAVKQIGKPPRLEKDLEIRYDGHLRA